MSPALYIPREVVHLIRDAIQLALPTCGWVEEGSFDGSSSDLGTETPLKRLGAAWSRVISLRWVDGRNRWIDDLLIETLRTTLPFAADLRLRVAQP